MTFGFLISKQVRRVCSDLGRALPPSVNLTVQGKGGAHLGFQRFRGVLCVSMANCFLVKEAMPVAAFALRRGGVRIYVVYLYFQGNHLWSWNLRFPVW